ncbi:hypothetical protein AAHE18_15G124900 [Arachis hypogaea]
MHANPRSTWPIWWPRPWMIFFGEAPTCVFFVIWLSAGSRTLSRASIVTFLRLGLLAMVLNLSPISLPTNSPSGAERDESRRRKKNNNVRRCLFILSLILYFCGLKLRNEEF